MNIHDKYNLDIDKYILKKSDVVFSIERKHIEKHNKDLLVFLDGLYGNSKFRSTFLNFNTLIDIALFYYDKIDDNNYKGTYGAFKYFSKIEKERNKAAHTMINIDEDFVKSNLNKSSEDLINNCETLLRMIFDYQSNYFIYKSINEEIINLLQETK